MDNNIDWIKVQLTRECNLKCKFCSQAEFKNDSTLNIEVFKKNVLNVCSPRLLIITGGEPLVRYDILKNLISYCKQNNIEVGIFSNATLLNEVVASELKLLGVDWVRVSLNGHCESIHEMSYPINSFKKTLNGIKIAMKYGLYVKIRSTVTKNNQNYLSEFIEFVSELNIKELDFRPYLMLGDCNPHIDHALNNDELIKNCALLLKKKKEYNDKLSIKLLPNWFDFLYLTKVCQSYVYNPEHCNCGRKYLYIDSEGNYRACAGHKLLLGNMHDKRIDEIWNNCSFLMQTRNYEQDLYCYNCYQKIQCHLSNCHLINYEVNGAFDKINPTCPLYNCDSKNVMNAQNLLEKKFKKYFYEKN